MEYPFKDLMPLDEVLEREGYYRDWTHLDPKTFYSIVQISEMIKTKGFGTDVRLLISQLAEHFGLSVVEVTDIANNLIGRQSAVEDRQDAVETFNTQVIQEMTDKDVISAPELIESRDGELKLSARLDRDFNRITTQLAQVAVHVTDFEADDTDWIDAINAAIDKVFAMGGGVVYFPTGTYLVKPTNSHYIEMKDNVHLLGSGFSELKVSDDNEDFDFIVTGTGSRLINSSFRNLNFNTNAEGNSTHDVSLITGRRRIIFRAQTASHIYFLNCKFYYSGVNAIISTGAMYGHKNLVIKDCYFKFDYQGSVSYDNTACYIGQIGHLIIGNLFESTKMLHPWAVTAIESHSSYGIVSNNIITGFHSGILILGVDYPNHDETVDWAQKNVSNNIIRECLNGITIWSSQDDVQHVNIQNNTIQVNHVTRERHSESVYGIALNHPMGGHTSNNIVRDVLISGNTIKFEFSNEWEDNTTAPTSSLYMGAFAIGALARNGELVRLKNIKISDNLIINAPRQPFVFACESDTPNQYRDIVIENNHCQNSVNQKSTSTRYRAALLLFGNITRLTFRNNTFNDDRENPMMVHEVYPRIPYSGLKDIVIEGNTFKQLSGEVGMAKHLPVASKPSGFITDEVKFYSFNQLSSMIGRSFEFADITISGLLGTTTVTDKVQRVTKAGTIKANPPKVIRTIDNEFLNLNASDDISSFKCGEYINLTNSDSSVVHLSEAKIIGIDYKDRRLVLSKSLAPASDMYIAYSHPNFQESNVLVYLKTLI